MRLLVALSAFMLLEVCIASEVLRPRGVSLIKASLYDPGKEFHCLDGSGIVPFTYVNDDYCDCRDGSDEPGTSACPNGSFHCPNVGHSAIDVRSSRVNDGVCDCCDGSDEWSGAADCRDVCLDLGRAAREEAMRLEEANRQGSNLKLGLIEQGKNIRMEKESQVTQIQFQLESAEAMKAQLEEAKRLAEEPEQKALERYREAEEAKKEADKATAASRNEAEAKEVFDALDTNQDGQVSKEEIQADTTYDTNRDGAVSEDEAAAGDDADLQVPDRVVFPGYHEEPDAEENHEQEGADEEDEDYDPEMYGEEGDDDEDPPPQDQTDEIVYDEETKALVDAANEARKALQESVDAVKDLQRRLKSEQESLDRDFGPSDEYRPLEGSCYELTDREYTYKLCPFDKATQSPQHGGGETRLGTWGAWVGEGEGSDAQYSAMKYTNGQGCWNGPNRSTLVKLQCGVEHKLVSATEPSKCEYQFVFLTPAACAGGDGEAAAARAAAASAREEEQGEHDEEEEEDHYQDEHTEL